MKSYTRRVTLPHFTCTYGTPSKRSPPPPTHATPLAALHTQVQQLEGSTTRSFPFPPQTAPGCADLGLGARPAPANPAVASHLGPGPPRPLPCLRLLQETTRARWVSALSAAPGFQGPRRRPGPVTSGPPGPRASPPPPAHPQSPRPLAGLGLCQTLLPCPQLPCLGSPALGKSRPASVVASWARTRRSRRRRRRHHRLLGLSASAPRP